MDNSIVLRIKDIISAYKLKQFSFAEKINMDAGNFSSILCGKRQVTRTIIDKITDAFPEINKSWLMYGNGEMFNYCHSLQGISQKSTLPLLPFDVMGGPLTGDNDGAILEQCERYIVPDFVARGAQFLVRVSGSSMYPKYSNGDILAIRKIENVSFFQWGKVYVLDTEQGAIVKRVFPADEGSITCRSDNHDNYPDFVINTDEIRGIGIVVGCIRME